MVRESIFTVDWNQRCHRTITVSKTNRATRIKLSTIDNIVTWDQRGIGARNILCLACFTYLLYPIHSSLSKCFTTFQQRIVFENIEIHISIQVLWSQVIISWRQASAVSCARCYRHNIFYWRIIHSDIRMMHCFICTPIFSDRCNIWLLASAISEGKRDALENRNLSSNVWWKVSALVEQNNRTVS